MSKIIVMVGLIAFGFLCGVHCMEQEIQKYGKEQFLKGYNQYLIDYHVPEPFTKIEVPIKKRNPRLIEKFNG